MIQKIQDVYDSIKHKYSDGINTVNVRSLLKEELISELGDNFEVKCDEENNPPLLLDLKCLVAKVIWNKNFGSYDYINLVFGDDNNIGQANIYIN